MAINKTLAMRLLEGKKVNYQAIQYDASERDAEMIALQLSVPPEQVFKTLVVVPPDGSRHKPLLAVIPANYQLNLKKVAKLLGVKKVKMASHKQAEQMTGLQVGGISPLALINKGFAIYLDELALAQPHIFVSAGERGTQIRLTPADLRKVTKAKLADLSSPTES
ncbi:aminoacyl-tRNA deacylase [Candidatus Leptofilum sp.]|uniref:aminoacyl-tRNA deacylase n=1 Tax=Candidatus Leptofilum sp. TaxID=3241576 RepID=UPI003B5C6DCE